MALLPRVLLTAAAFGLLFPLAGRLLWSPLYPPMAEGVTQLRSLGGYLRFTGLMTGLGALVGLTQHAAYYLPWDRARRMGAALSLWCGALALSLGAELAAAPSWSIVRLFVVSALGLSLLSTPFVRASAVPQFGGTRSRRPESANAPPPHGQ